MRYVNCDSFLQLFRERLSEKNVHATIPKGNMGYDQYIVLDTVAVELYSNSASQSGD